MKPMKKPSNGFTIIELLVVIAIIGILTTIGIVSFSRIQSSSRDSQRSSKTVAISEALEKYFDKNGEYPSCAQMADSVSAITTTTLKDVDPNILATPSASAGTNSILPSCADLTAGVDGFAYIGDSNCVSTPGQTCLQYTLKYREESTGQIKTITGRRTSVALLTQPSSSPTITSVVLNGSNVQATMSTVTCNAGTAQYRIRIRTNDGTWGSYSGWSGSTTDTSQVAADGVKYGYQAQAQCLSGSLFSNPTTSAENTYIDPIGTIPTVPGVSANTGGYDYMVMATCNWLCSWYDS
jgi:prepilin-type N-terminal cleavage/methylation domain-containing protein